MSTAIYNDRLTIKDIIFTKAIPNYNIPVSTDGYKIFSCTDCGDKFLFDSSYNYHMDRKSLKITFFCRNCMRTIIFYNRCKLLSHIRSHAFKSATITVSDLKLEPLPLEHFHLPTLKSTFDKQISDNPSNTIKKNVCHECNTVIGKTGLTYQVRAAHYMQFSKEAHSCPICMFLLPTVCALEAHLRIHLNIPPFFCPECGIHLPNRIILYPFDHKCEGFKMMKATTKIRCKFNSCKIIYHPNEYRSHLITHINKVYRCSFCLEVWRNKRETLCTLCKNGNISSYFECPLCPNKLFVQSHFERHLNSHCNNIRMILYNQVYPCFTCNSLYDHMFNLINHHVNKHSSSNLKNLLSKVLVKAKSEKPEIANHVIKKCSKCLRRYQCFYEDIQSLSNECPYKCSMNSDGRESLQFTKPKDSQIECFLCKNRINQNWANIKTHYAKFHKNHKCLDLQVLVKRLDPKLLLAKSNRKNFKRSAIVKNRPKKIDATKFDFNMKENESIHELKDRLKRLNICTVCNCVCETKQNLESHLITHRDPSMAYQCLECGQCFAVKPSFSTHLLIEHGIPDAKEYINNKPCYNELAMLKYQNILNPTIQEPVIENQCRICREKFENSDDYDKHFRVHGMAFLMKNAHKNSSP